jgi:hypothetical protein
MNRIDVHKCFLMYVYCKTTPFLSTQKHDFGPISTHIRIVFVFLHAIVISTMWLLWRRGPPTISLHMNRKPVTGNVIVSIIMCDRCILTCSQIFWILVGDIWIGFAKMLSDNNARAYQINVPWAIKSDR